MKRLHIITGIGLFFLIIAPMPPESQPQAEPVQAAQAEPVQTEPVQAEPVQTEPVQAVQAEPVQTEPVQAKPVQTEPVQAVQAEPVQTEPVQAKPVQTEPVQAVQAEPVQTEPVQAKPVQTEPVQAVQAEPVQTEAVQTPGRCQAALEALKRGDTSWPDQLGQQQCPLWVNSGRAALKFRCPLYPRKRTCWPTRSGCLLWANRRHLSQSSNSSARTIRPSGTSIPSVFAVVRLITSSNLVGRKTGRSAGLAPLRMRSTYAAVCRNTLGRSTP